MPSVNDLDSIVTQQTASEYAYSEYYDVPSILISRPTSSLSTSPSSRSIASRTGLTAAPERPPDYVTAIGRPTVPVAYKFKRAPYNSMVVTQYSEEDTEAGAKFHILTAMDGFMPLCHITTIRRGSSRHGELVAEFEMGISDDPATITIADKEILMDSMLSKLQGSRHSALWFWSGPAHGAKGLLWDTRKTPYLCMSMRKIGGGTESKLTVTPLGHDYFDELLLSLLIIERKRLTPGKDSILKQLFN